MVDGIVVSKFFSIIIIKIIGFSTYLKWLVVLRTLKGAGGRVCQQGYLLWSGSLEKEGQIVHCYLTYTMYSLLLLLLIIIYYYYGLVIIYYYSLLLFIIFLFWCCCYYINIIVNSLFCVVFFVLFVCCVLCCLFVVFCVVCLLFASSGFLNIQYLPEH